jgi:DNA-binding NtrC family response regulator
MPAQVQRTLIPLVERLESERESSPAIRLITGTTVSLLERVIAGTFSELLFYRLNIIHLDIGDDRACNRGSSDASELAAVARDR